MNRLLLLYLKLITPLATLSATTADASLKLSVSQNSPRHCRPHLGGEKTATETPLESSKDLVVDLTAWLTYRVRMEIPFL